MESLDALQARHRKELKDLQSRITQKKKNASKKTRKGVNTECDELERQLKERQEQEVQALTRGNAQGQDEDELEHEEGENEVEAEREVNGVTDGLAKATISESTQQNDEDGEGEVDANQPRKRNRAKERLARRAAEQEAAVEAAKLEAANQPDQKAVEREKLLKEFAANGRQEKLIRPDGHCLFSAVADQLSQAGIPLGGAADEVREDQRYTVVRRAAADYIESHPDDFAGWLEEPLEGYVRKIRETAEWGGHLELLALARRYEVQICVLQDGGKQSIGEGEEKIWLAYYRHGFGLGEHYNSLRKAP